MKKTFTILLTFLLIITGITSQESLKSYQEEYYDFLSLQGTVIRPTLGYRTLSDSVWTLSTDAEHIWMNNNLESSKKIFSIDNPSSNFFLDGINQGLSLRIYGPELFNSYNTSYPFGQNDGALWQGTGLNSSLTTGIRLDGFGFEATFKPQITFSENKDWDYLTGIINPYGYFSWQIIDIVQRYGDKPFYTYSWGDSEIRWTWNTFTVGWGTQSPWLGPSWLNPMLGSNNADPYPKLDVGLRKTPIIIPGLNWNLGELEARIWLGRLIQSDYFPVERNTDRMINMGTLSFSPSFIDGFTVGLNRLFMTYWQKENLSYFLRLFDFRSNNGTGTGNDEDQKAALFVDWVFPESGFEVYGELGIDDFTWSIVANTFHTAIYTIGVKQIIPITNSISSLINLEWNTGEKSQDYYQADYYGYYYHGWVSQGFTNNGQIIGAGTGFSGNNQVLKYTILFPKGKISIKGQKYSQNNNYLINKVESGAVTASYPDKYAHIKYETYLSGGIEALYFCTPDISISAGLTAVKRYFPKYQGLKGEEENSINATFSCKYTF